MKKNVLIVLMAVTFIVSCSRVPITGRKQMNMLPESDLMSMSLSNYRNFLKKNNVLPESDPRTVLVKTVGTNISKAVNEFMLANKKYANRIQGFNWEFNVVEDKVVNAWCMPGGKVVVYTGLLPITEDSRG